LQKAAHASLEVPVEKLDAAQLRDEISKPDGYVLRRPEHWR
jgi:hypothetical protein